MDETPARRGRPRLRPSTSTLDPTKDVLDAAHALFTRKGFQGTSMTEIARAVGLQRASLYHYFPNKQAIYFALVKQYMWPLFSMMHQWEAEGVEGGIAYYRLLRIDLRHMLNAPFDLQIVMSVSSEERNALLGRDWTVLSETYARFLESAVTAGEFREVDPVLTSALLDAAIVGLLSASSDRSVSAISGTPVLEIDVGRTVDTFAELVLRSVLVEPETFTQLHADALQLDGPDPRLMR